MTKLSVIIPTYNRPEQLKEAVNSVLDQRLEDLEIIIIDDASDPESQNQIDAISSLSSRVHLKRNMSNSGVPTCRNIGLENAKGDYILFLDDDDVLLPNMLKQSIEVIEKEEIDLVSCRVEVVGAHLPDNKINTYNHQQNDSIDHLYQMEDRPAEHIFLYHPQVHSFLIRCEAIGGTRFLSEYDYGEDMLFWLALAQKGLKFKKVNFIGSRYHLHERSASLQASFASKIKFYHSVYRNYSTSKSMKSLCWLKMAMVALKSGDYRFVIWLLRSCQVSPKLFFRHAKHYARLFFKSP
ncbi:MAG: glycosyltransferase family 2 protein [Reichenbachiella sp.]|uniref:glycosyltransferase family 2 protein n=1 Tax=Reichenbachiella sp. TaxID=2184521 RepID=UPI003265F241